MSGDNLLVSPAGSRRCRACAALRHQAKRRNLPLTSLREAS